MKSLILFTILFVVSCEVFSQPCTNVEELHRKKHFVDGRLLGHPYTMFDKHNNLTFDQTIGNIRNRIRSEKLLADTLAKPVYSAYKLVYENASSTRPSDNGMSNEGVSALAQWAKNNAFVFLIGLRYARINVLGYTF